jgi:hypothetical protein
MFMEARVVLTDGNYVYCVGDRGIWIYDISIPSSPSMVSYTPQDAMNTSEAILYYPYLYYFYGSPLGYASNSVNMLDVSNPASPVLHTDILPLGGVFASGLLAANSTNLYVAKIDFANNVIIDIFDRSTDPANPTFMDSFAGQQYAYDMILVDPEGLDTHLVVSNAFDVQSYSVEDSGNPFSTGSYTFVTNPGRELIAYGNMIYVVHNSGSLIVLEQSPITLDYKTTIALPSQTNSIDINFPDLYIGCQSTGLVHLDITNPLLPVLDASYPTISYGTDVAVAGNFIYIIPYQAGLEIFENPGTVPLVNHGQLPVVNIPLTGQLNGDYLYTTVEEGLYLALVTIDITDPGSALVVSRLAVPASLRHVALQGGILAGLGGGSMCVFDVTDPSAPTLINTLPITGIDRGLAMKGPIVYAAMYDGTDTSIEAYEVDPFSYYGSTLMSGEVWDLTVTGDTLYAQKFNSIQIFDITDPYNPAASGTYILAGVSDESEAFGNILYSVDYNGLEIADITDPQAPVFISTIPIVTPDYFDQVAIDGMYVFIAGYNQAPNIISVFYPSNMIDLGPIYAHPEYMAVDLQASNGYLYEISYNYGVRIHSYN